jgi:dienelactone hydrolase
MHTADVEYEYEGTRLVGFLAVDDDRSGTRPGVLIAHDAAGRGEHVKQVARRLAELGYVALAIDYHGGGCLL